MSDFINLLQSMDFLVEASDTEQFFLWKQSVEEYKFCSAEQWQSQIGRSHIITQVHGRPINIQLMPVLIKGIHIGFYDCISQLADWLIVEKFIEEHFTKKYNGSRATTDALNFSHALHYINDKCKIT